MDNYKIKVKDEAESKEAQELFVQLGYELDSFFGNYEASTKWVLACTDGSMGCASDGMAKDTLKEITFPRLRDLVVLKRNDVKDANYRSKRVSDGLYFKSCDGIFYFMFEGKWVQSEVNTAEGLEPITQDPALISGADALRALADGKEVEFYNPSPENQGWMNYAEGLTAREFLGGYFVCSDDGEKINTKFRLKPQTIKLELELPKPFEPKEFEDCYMLTDLYEHGYVKTSWKYSKSVPAWRTEAEIKQVVEQLRKIRGTNS